jgi:hypothetical protein
MKIRQIKLALFARRPAPKAVAIKLYSVMRRKDSAIVAQGVTREVAEELVAKAIRQKRASLVIA